MNPSIIKALKFSGITVAGIAALFVILEPAISWAIGDQFIVTQEITSEISFLTATLDVTDPQLFVTTTS